MILIVLITAALSVICGLGVLLYLLDQVADRLRRFADASMMILNRLPFGVVIPTRDPDLVVCNRTVTEWLELDGDAGLFSMATALPCAHSLDANPRLAALLATADAAGIAALDIGDGAIIRVRRDLRSEQTERGAISALEFHQLHAAAAAPPTSRARLRDELTGLVDFALFEDRALQALEAAARSGSVVALLVLELDQHGEVEEKHGSATAQRLLIEAAGRISATGRAMETVARIGASRFAIVLKHVEDEKLAQRAAQRFAEAATFEFALGENASIRITASLGLAVARPGAALAPLLANAEETCRDARLQGGDCMRAHLIAGPGAPSGAR